MASGTISISSPSKSAATYLAWSSSSNGSEKNSSVVSATAYFRKTNGYTTTGTFSGTITIDGTAYSIKPSAVRRKRWRTMRMEHGRWGSA